MKGLFEEGKLLSNYQLSIKSISLATNVKIVNYCLYNQELSWYNCQNSKFSHWSSPQRIIAGRPTVLCKTE